MKKIKGDSLTHGAFAKCPICRRGWVAEIQFGPNDLWGPFLVLFCEHVSHVETDRVSGNLAFVMMEEGDHVAAK